MESSLNNDYLTSLSSEEKNIFLAIICTLAKIDGHIHQTEKTFLQDFAKELKIGFSPRYFSLTTKDCIKHATQIKDRRLAMEIIKYMLILAYTDNEFSDSEGNFIGAIAEALNLEAQKVAEISSWIIDRIIWLEQEAVIFEQS